MKKFIILIDGPMGSGKSTVGELLSKKLKRTALINEDKIKWFISDFKRSKRDNAIIRSVLIEMAREFSKKSINLIIAQGFSKTHRPVTPFAKIAKQNKSKIFMYHLDAPKEILLERIKNRKKSKIIRAPIAKSRIHRNIRIWKKNRYTNGVEFNVDKMSARSVLNKIIKDLKS